ncbi:MAG: hypothetical protein GVY13_06530 [Alphaproteobacteria bacterium]|jgi:type VI protein secretion system component VasF|nr:hypothetical protein [Alphaproteobacteria bacterium]
MDRNAADIARRAAAQLGPNDRRFLQAVDHALAGPADGPPQRYVGLEAVVAVASLVVAAASLAWSVWQGLQQRKSDEAMARLIDTLRAQLTQPPGVPAAERERVIEHVARETAAIADRSGEAPS